MVTVVSSRSIVSAKAHLRDQLHLLQKVEELLQCGDLMMSTTCNPQQLNQSDRTPWALPPQCVKG